MTIWMDVDTALTEVPVNVAPLIDDTDFKTIETAVAYNASGMALNWHFITTAGVHTITAVTPTAAGVYDWTHQGQGMYTIEIPASGGASINNDTEGYGYFTGFVTGVLPWRSPTFGFRAAALNNALIDGGDNLDVDNVTGNVSGSVGSVTGAVGSVTGSVGSVTGNVNGNVVGSTASVTGPVGSVAGNVAGDVAGKVLGGGSGTITGDGVRSSSVTGAVGSVTGAVGSVTGTVGGIAGTLQTFDAIWTKIKNWLGALAGKTADATTLAEIQATTAGATYNNTTDALEAIRDRGDAAWITGSSGGGTGARVVTITVNDGSTVLENAKVRMTNGAESYVVATNASGVAAFALDDATWTVSITKPLYTFTTTTLIVNGTETQTYSMTAVSIPASSPGLVSGYVYCYDETGTAESGVTIKMKITEVASSTGYAYDGTVREGTSDANGLVSFTNLFKGATYKIWRGRSPAAAVDVAVAAAAVSPVVLTSFIGEA